MKKHSSILYLLLFLLILNIAFAATFKEAEVYLKNNQYEKSIKAYQSVLQENPNDISAMQGLARAYAYSDQHKQAIEVYKKLLKNDSKHRLNYFIALGWQTLWSNDFKMALQYFKTSLLIDPENKEAKRGLFEASNPEVYQARILIRNKKFELALEKLKPYLNSSVVSVQLDIAKTYANLSNYDAAVSHYKTALKLQPSLRSSIILPLAFQYLWSQNFKEAVPLFKEYLNDHPEDKRAKEGLFEASHSELYLARIARNQVKYQESINNYKKLVAKYPNNILFLTELAEAYTRNDNLPEAEKIYKNLIFHYHDKSSYLSYAWVLLWSGQPEKARHFFLLAKQQGASPEKVLSGLMQSLSGRQNDLLYELETMIYAYKIPEAKTFAWKILKLDPKNESWYLEVAEKFADAGYDRISKDILLKGIQMSPQNRLILLPTLAWNEFWLNDQRQACKLFYQLQGNTENPMSIVNAFGYCIDYFKGHAAAIKYYKTLSKNKNSDEYTEWQLRLAYLYLMQRRYDKAAKVLKQILYYEPNNADALTEYGNTLAFRDYNMQAVRWLKHALKILPANAVLQEHLARAYYWLDMGDKALETFSKPVPMRLKSYYTHWNATKRAFSNRVYLSYHHLDTSDGLHLNSGSVELQHYITDSTSLNGLIAAGHLTGAVDSGNWSSALLGFKTYFGDVDSSYGLVYPQVYLGAGSYLGWKPFLWNIDVDWRKSDNFSTNLESKNEVILDSLAQGYHVLYSSVSLDPTYFNDTWLVESHFQAGRFSGNNNRTLAGLDILRNVYRPASVYIGPYIEYFSDSDPNENRGYYNPSSYTELSVIIKSDIELSDKWSLAPYVKLGVFNDDTNSSFQQKIYDLRLQLSYDQSLYQKFTVEASYFNSGSGGFGGGGGVGYKAFALNLDYHYYF